MKKTRVSSILAVIIITGCASVSDGRVMVRGAGSDDLLKLRTGPGQEHDIIMGLPDGTRLIRQGCRPVAGRSWCKVSLTNTPNISGYVSAEYLAVY